MPDLYEAIPLLEHGYAKVIETWGSDQRIIESARMSTDKGFLGWGPKEDGSAGDEKLLRYLHERHHDTPFEFAGLVVEIQAPIFVFREWHRHRTQSYNEMSGRYTVLPNLYYLPSIERLRTGGQSTVNKQSSGEPLTIEEATCLRAIMRNSYEDSRRSYEELLRRGLAKELARDVLPVAQMSRMRASANLRNWLSFLTLRMPSAAQWEIRQYALVIASFVAQAFPKTWALFAERPCVTGQ